MSVSNGQLANQTVFNAAFWSRTTSTTGVGVYRIANVDASSGDPVDNMQREFNSITSFIGMSLDLAATGVPTWASDDIGVANEPVKDRVESVQAALETAQTDIATKIGWSKYTFDYTDFSTAAASSAIALVTVAANTHVGGIVIKHSTAFLGGTLTDYLISVGPSGDVTRYVDEFDVNQTVATSAFQSISLSDVPFWATTGTIAIQAASTGDDLDGASGGSVDVWILSAPLPSS